MFGVLTHALPSSLQQLIRPRTGPAQPKNRPGSAPELDGLSPRTGLAQHQNWPGSAQEQAWLSPRTGPAQPKNWPR
ncbi:hypothetical protein NHX12_021272 [Muraenolepis orangiensis]|uniref:Uncharacterized protein n=1 Tax=Muraenolepis orangiensis TaxID=630683 RepID=A0A9Q0EQ86_9TELE|nr:hypothetical protein NHX12_021272 [Muraenolepis orangiensis]